MPFFPVFCIFFEEDDQKKGTFLLDTDKKE